MTHVHPCFEVGCPVVFEAELLEDVMAARLPLQLLQNWRRSVECIVPRGRVSEQAKACGGEVSL